MSVIFVKDPQTGIDYSVNISGTEPTENEQQQINDFLVSKRDQAPVAVQPPEPEEEDKTAFMRGLEREPYENQLAQGKTKEVLADTFVGKMFGLDAEAAQEQQKNALAELQRLEAEDPSVRYDDVNDLSSAASFAGEALGSEAKDTAIQAGATLAGLPFGPVGAGITRAAGVGYTTVKALPQMFAEAINKQEEAGMDTSILRAGGATAINAASEFLIDYFVIGKFIKPVDAGRARKVLMEGGQAGGLEGLQEVSQSMVNRAQAGQDLFDEDALKEYEEAFASGAVVGGTIGSAAGLVSPTVDTDKVSKELDEDLTKLGEVARTRLAYGLEQTEQEVKEVDEILSAPEPQVQLALPAPTATPEDQLVNRAADVVLSSMRVEGELKFPKARIALQKSGLSGETQKQTDSLIKQARDSLTTQGVISKSQRAKTDRYTVTPPTKMAENALDNVRRDSANVVVKANKIAKDIPQLELDLRYATQTGKDTRGNAVKAEEVQAALDNKKVQLNKLNARLESNQQKLVTLPDDYKVQASEKIESIPGKVTPEQLKAEIGPQLQAAEKRGETRTIFDGLSKEQVEKKPEYTQREEAVMNNLRERLDKMGLKRVGLKGQKVIGSQDSLVEGQFDPMSEEKAITLALGVYDPSLSDADYTNSVAEVMNHEAVHAIVDMNVFTPKEINLLKKAAKKTKFVNPEGKKRSYSYLDRAGRLNGELVGQKGDKGRMSAVEEEAIAEMYRDFTAGRLKNVGTSRPLLKRIGDFFRSIVGAHVDNGFNNVGAIFGGIGAGSVADRAPVTTVTQTPTSRTEVTTARQSRIPASLPKEIRDSINDLSSLFQTNPPRQQIDMHPSISSVVSQMNQREQTNLRPDYNSENWHNTRTYLVNGERVMGTPNALRAFERQAEQLGFVEMGLQPKPIPKNREAIILVGPPASGKSTIANELATSKGFAIADSDEIKKSLPEYEGGIGAAAVHEESSDLVSGLYELMMSRGTNIMIPKVGDKSKSIVQLIDKLKEKGYKVNLVNMDVAPEEAYSRMIGRFVNTGRIIPIGYFDSIRDNPTKVFEKLKQDGIADGYAQIDNNGGVNEPKSVTKVSGNNPLVGSRFDPFKRGTTRVESDNEINGQSDTARTRLTDQVESAFGDIDRAASGIKTSRVPLTPAQRDASILDYLNPKTGQPQFKKKEGSETLVSFAEKLLGLRNVAPLDIINSERDKQDAARIMAAEAEAALISGSDALGWYDSTLKLAKRVLFPVYPEVSPERPDGSPNSEYDPAAEHAFDFATAITSNGLSVIDNYRFASEQYDAWKASDSGTFPVKGSGAQGGSMLSAFEFWNTLSRKGMSSNEIEALLTMQMPKKDLNKTMVDVLGVDRVKDLPKEFQASGAEEANTMVSVAYILGPKIGNGFYQNLRGNYDPLTMDRWWMRFANRITGNPTVKYADELVEQNLDTVWNFITEADQPLTDMDRNILFEAQRKLNISTMDKTDIPLIAPEIGKIWNRDHYTKAYKDTVEDLLTSGQYEFSLNKSKTPVGRDAATVKSLAAASRPSKTAFLRATETYQKKLIPTLQEDPRNAQDRTAMREVANRARQILKDEAGVDITNADFQALMWYAEKRLFEAGGVRKGRGDDNDYADGALNILKNKGIGDDKIKNSLPATERGRLAGIIAQREGDGSVSGSVDAVKPTIAEGDFFAPRELALEAAPFITEADVDLSTMEDVESSNELPPQKLSQIPIDPYKAIRTPVKRTGTLTDIIYGGIQETDGEVIPVLLTEGSNDQFDNGGGLYHIQQRLHDKELVENSGYKRVEKAIYDTLHRWKSQGYQDGDSVVAYPSGGNLVLEWFDNRMAKSPPLRLVLERGKRNSGNGPYYVKTFFPVMDKKDRKKIRNSQIKLSALNTVSGTGLDAMQADRVTRYTDIADWLGKALRLVPFTDKTKAQKRADLFIQKTQDSFIPVGRMIKELKEINPQYKIADSMDPYLKQQLSEGIAGSKITERKETIYKAATDAVKNMNITEQQVDQLKALSNANSGGGKGLAEFTFEGTKSKALSAVDTYLYAKHAKERNAYIRTVDPTNDAGSGMTDAEADAILNWFDSLDPQNKIALRQAEDAVRSIVDDTNAVRVAAGLQSSDMKIGDMEDSNFDFYVPLKGHFEVDQEGIYGSGKPSRYGAMGREDQRALGRRSYGRDILASTILQNTNSIVRGERNKVGKSMLDLVRSNPQGMSGYAEILDQPPSARVMQNGAVVIKPTRTYRDDPSIAIVKENGEEKVLQFYDNNLAGAFNGENIWDAGNAATITRGLAKVNRYLSNINTSWNPEFFISNFIRDVQAAGIQVSEFEMDGLRKDTIRNVLKAAKGLKRSILNKDDSSEWAKIYKEFRSYGGASAANPMTTLQDQISDLQSTLSDISDASGKLGLMKAKGKKLLEFMDNSNLVVENAIRVSTYDALVKRGVSKERAAQAARSVTVDFGKGGDNKAFLNSLYLFYNASLQGSFFLLRSLARSKKVRNIMGGVIAVGFTQDIINSMMSDEDEDGVKQYDKIPDYILEHNMVFMLPDVMDPFGRGYVSIPMPYGMNAFHNVGRNFAKMAQGRSDPSEIGASIGRTTLEIFNPLGGTESFLNFAAPTVFDPFISLYGTNTDFSGRDIVKKAFPNQVASQSSLYWNNTSPTAVGITQALNELTGGTETLSGWIDWSPNSLEFWFDYITGGAGRFVQRTAEAPARIAAAESAEDIATEIPFMRRVLRSVSSRDDVSQYIEVRDQVNRATAEYKKAAQRGDVDRINSAVSRFEAELRIAPQIKKIESARRKISQQITAVNDSRLPQDEKDRIVKQLVEQRKIITRQGIMIAQGI
ncbi:zeta toxin family protein [Alphaproteobacteria bacterium]|nr:zeta toxin family protein [Alphaproteobacteria bacterium]